MQGKTDFWNTLSPAILHKTAAILNFAPKLVGLATQYFWQQYLCTAESSTAKVLKMAATRCRNLENLLKFKPKSREKRKRLYKNLVTALVQYERVETTINRCHDLSRVAERVSPCKIALKWICMGNSMISCDIWHKYHE